jgi:hypothetical protein
MAGPRAARVQLHITNRNHVRQLCQIPDGVDNLKQMVLELLALRQSRAPGAELVRSVAVHHLSRLEHLLDQLQQVLD